MHDELVNPSHYNCFEHQPREVSGEWFGYGRPAAFIGFDLSHVLSYLARLGDKDPMAYPPGSSELDRIAIDLGKAQDFIEHARKYTERIAREGGDDVDKRSTE
ncbi:MAG: DUF3310 domain-containing protein [bacterium]|nr:DUF3310 domain-containing protein [bacterium]